MVKAKIRCAGASDAGRVRRNNEDAFYLDAERGIFLVVDGIGGQAAGEKAAELAVKRVRARLERQTGTAEQRIREAIAMANNEILHAARENREWEGMACVLTVAVLENGSAVIGHVGDSRLYQVRRGEIRKLTHDHSPVGEREDSRELTEAEAMRHPRRNEVYRDVGSEEHAPDDPDFIEIIRTPFEPDSALLLCSDGLSDQVPSSEIRRAVEQNAGHPDIAVEELIEAANRSGGKDNVTVLVVEGEQFSTAKSAPAAETARNRPALYLSQAAMLVYGILLAAGAAWFTRSWWVPPPVVITPQVLTAGPGAPFPTIAAAMAQARAGDTIEVLGGEYREEIRLKSGVTVKSRVPREAILRAAPDSTGPAVRAEDVKQARIAGFRILADQNLPLAAAIVLSNSDVEVEDMEVTGAATGVEISGAGATVLRGNLIRDCSGEGIRIAGAGSPWISHNILQRNKGAGIAGREGARPVLMGNTFEKSALELPGETSMDAVRERNSFLDPKPPVRPRPARVPAAPSKGEARP